MLIAEVSGFPPALRTLARERAYVRVAEGFDAAGARLIRRDAFSRAVDAVEAFSRLLDDHGAESVCAVATGVIREAVNQQEFVDHIFERTAVRVRPITGAREAWLTGTGVLHALGIQAGPFFIFDVGGGSTECFYGIKGEEKARSLPLGASLLTQQYFSSDPPGDREITALLAHVRDHIRWTKGVVRPARIAAAGGTVVALAAMVHGIAVQGLTPEKVNGLRVSVPQLDECLMHLSRLRLEQRTRRVGLDRDRARVILAGALVVRRLLGNLGSHTLEVSMSDLLEGMAADSSASARFHGDGHYLKGDCNNE
ncbi:MAG: hypothetical protein ACLFUT_14155 [Desulfobacteraceae bacterium]